MASAVRKGPMAPTPQRPELTALIEKATHRQVEERMVRASLTPQERYWYSVATLARKLCTQGKPGETREQCLRRYFVMLHEDEEIADWLLAHPPLRTYLGLP